MSFKWTKSPERVHEVTVRQKPIQKKTKSVADMVGGEAEAILAANRHDGHAEISVETGDHSDAYVYLDDSKGQGAALSIEFGHMHGGRKGWERGDKVIFVEGVAPLRGAVAKVV